MKKCGQCDSKRRTQSVYMVSVKAALYQAVAIALLAIVTGCSRVIKVPQTSASNSLGAASQTNANNSQLALAMHLKKVGAKMYGAFWCPVCKWQRQQFGEAAFRQITYIECDPNGSNPQPNLCNQMNIHAYPTWEINGRLFEPGGYPLQELANISGYQGPRDFGS